MKTTIRLSCIAILVVSVILAGCSPKPGTETPPGTEPAGPTEVATGLQVDRAIRLDPATAEDDDSLVVNAFLYEGLVQLDASGAPQPALAVSWTISDDELDYVINLRPDVTFHNGNAFNADVVLANFNRWFDPANSLHNDLAYAGWEEFFLGFKGEFDETGAAVSPFDGIEKIDNLTILIHLNRPVPDLITYLAQPYFAILDPEVMAGGVDMLGSSVETVSGTGPYSLLAWTDAGLTLIPNVNYWDVVPTEDMRIGWK